MGSVYLHCILSISLLVTVDATTVVSTTGSAWITQQLNQSLSSDSRVWKQRYYYNLEYLEENGPIFLVLGGNEEITASCVTGNDSMVVQWAQKYHAAVYCLEHRFYGNSQPFSTLKENFTSVQQLTYLSSQQAVEDAAKFIKFISNNDSHYQSYQNSPSWVLFGGFYGGSIALWLRQKYPELSIGAVVSSAPVMGKLDFYEYVEAVQDNYYRYNSVCADEIREGFKNVSQQMLTTAGRNDIDKVVQQITGKDGFSKQLTHENMMQFYYETVQNLAQIFEKLSYLSDMEDICNVMADNSTNFLLRLWTNRRNTMITVDDLAELVLNDSDSRSWWWQKCNEFGFMESTDFQQSEDMFGGIFSTSLLLGFCQQIFNIQVNAQNLKVNVEATNDYYGGQSGYRGTNVVMIRGDVDPYNSLQYYIAPHATVNQYLVPGLARCGDMYRSTYAVNSSLKYVEQLIDASIQDWLNEAAHGVYLNQSTVKISYTSSTNRTDFSQLLESEVQSFMVDNFPSLRFPLPDPANSEHMLNYPEEYQIGVFDRTFIQHSGRQFSLKQRFWKNMHFYESGGPCFLMLGGMSEASPKWILNNDLPIMQLAKKYHAGVYLLEHRFYGQSIPEDGFTMENLQYLNIEQVLLDIREFINEMNFGLGGQQNWILFGGSYAGSLAAWFRAKFGDEYSIAAVASSAPVDTPVDFFESALWTEKAINQNSVSCASQVRQQFLRLYQNAAVESGREMLSSKLPLQPAWNVTTVVNSTDLLFMFRNIIAYFFFAAQFNGNAEMSIPSGGIGMLCKNRSASGRFMDQLAATLGDLRSYYNINSSSVANNYTYYVELLRSTSAKSTFAAERCRLYQMCNELGQFSSTDTGTDMFSSVLPVNFYLNLCMNVFGEKFTAEYIYNSAKSTAAQYGGKTNFKGRNVIFVNGEMDPWSELSITEAANGIDVINVSGASHCAWMYPSNSSSSNFQSITNAWTEIDNFIATQLSTANATTEANPHATATSITTTTTDNSTTYLIWYYSYSYASPILLVIIIALACIFPILLACILMHNASLPNNHNHPINNAWESFPAANEAPVLPEKIAIPDYVSNTSPVIAVN